MADKALVLDANILIRAVLGERVQRIIESHAKKATLLVPREAYDEAAEHLSSLVTRRGGDPEKAMRMLRAVVDLPDIVERELYGVFEGCGIATWTSAKVEIYLEGQIA